MNSRYSWSLVALSIVATLSDRVDARVPNAELELGTLRAPIVGGRRADESERYATVAIADPHAEIVCSGVAVGPRVIVTAAHCVTVKHSDGTEREALPPHDFRVWEQWREPPEARAHALEVISVVPHPGYPGVRAIELGGSDWDEPYLHHDLALLILAQPLRELTPAPLASERTLDHLPEQSELFISGYGLREDGLMATGLVIASTPLREIAETEFIAGDAGFADTCKGDSGGPAYLPADTQVLLLGVVSRSRSQSPVCGIGGIYTLLPHYRDWIEAVSAEHTSHASCTAAPARPSDMASGWRLVACAVGLCGLRHRLRRALRIPQRLALERARSTPRPSRAAR